MYDLLWNNRSTKPYTYELLLGALHNTEFIYFIDSDRRRIKDGINLRHRYALMTTEYEDEYESIMEELDCPSCSVLEMMVALAIRCEEEIMDDPNVGDRTANWFWGMIRNLGLGSMTDVNFDDEYVKDRIEIFLYREYEPDGKGGLFTIKNCDIDLRTVEIWTQLCWYIDSIAL